MTGCANLYFYSAVVQTWPANNVYIFLARGDGSTAYVNLRGRDVHLQQIKSATRESRGLCRYYYRFGKLRVSIVIENVKPDNAPVAGGDAAFKITITLRKGRALRTVRAVGDADC
jgi:hypothetical protein